MGLSWNGSRIDTGQGGTASEREFHNQSRYVAPEGAARDLSINLYGLVHRAGHDLNEIWPFVEYPPDF